MLGGTFRRIQFTPDLVPSDLVGTRVYRPDTGRFDTELGPVFGNFLLADEINRAPAKVQSALLEVMQERQVTIGGQTYPLPAPFLVLATQNPIESEGTYPLPEAQVDRFLFKLLVDYPSVGEEAAVVGRAIGAPAAVRERISVAELERYRAAAQRIFVDRDVIGYAVALADATRHPERYGLHDLAPLIEYGASPRGPIGMIQAAQALALLRGRGHVVRRGRGGPRRRRAAPPARAHLRRARRRREGRRRARPRARQRRRRHARAGAGGRGGMTLQAVPPLADPPGRQGPGPMPGALVEALDLVLARRAAGALPGEKRAAGRGAGTELAQIRPYQVGDDVRRLDAAASARTGLPHVRDHVPERALTTWLLLDVSASMAWGTAARLKSDVAEGVAEVVGRLAVRRAGRVALLTCGAAAPRLLAPRGGRSGARRAAQGARGGRRRGRPSRRRPTRSPTALRRVALLARGPGLVVVVSDFREGDPRARSGRRGRVPWARSPRATTCSPSRSSTRARATLPDVGHLVLVDPETGRRTEADTASRRAAPVVRGRRAGAPRRRRGRAAARPRPARDGVARTATGCARSDRSLR